jgi:molybdenum cofactor biosynthesis enzyme MoaA
MLNVVGQPEMHAEAFCERPFTRMKVTPEGDCSVCCFQRRNTIGNLLKDSFEEVCTGLKAQGIREATANRELHRTCVVNNCPFNTNIMKLNPFGFSYGKYPSMIELDLPTQHCNIGGVKPSDENPACLMCERSVNFVKQKDRLDEVCEIIKPYVRYLNHIHIQGVSEPFWKNRIFELLENLDIYEHRNHLSVSSTTNATILTRERRERFLEYPDSSLTFSLDASTPGVYRVLRVWDAYDKVVNNLMAYSKERTSENQRIIIHNNINLININDVVGMVKVAADAGVYALEFNPTYAVHTICVNKSNAKLFKRAEEEIIEEAQKLDVPVVFVRPLDLGLSKSNPIHQIKL